MKKLAILFLLTAVIVSFTFAQVSLKADFSVANVNKGNSAVEDKDPGRPVNGTAGQIGYADPVLKFVFSAGKAQPLGPGSLSFSGAVGIKNSFHDTDYGMLRVAAESNVASNFLGGSGVAPTDDTYAGAAYGLDLGPGNLGFGLNYEFRGISEYYMWQLVPSVSYTAINAGPVVFGVGLDYKYRFNGISTDNSQKTQKGAAFFRPYGDSWSQDVIDFWFDVKTAFGLYIKYNFTYGWGKDATGRAGFYRGVEQRTDEFKRDATSSELQGQREIANIAFLDITYALGGLAKVGLEVDDTGPGFRGAYLKEGSTSGYDQFNAETVGFTLKPKASFAVDNIGFGLYLKFTNIMPTNVDQEIKVTPGLWVSYTL